MSSPARTRPTCANVLGTRLFTVAGDVDAPATVELSTGATLDAALPAVETVEGRKAACVGGVFGGLTRSLDVPASAPGLESARLGTNGVVELLGESTCMVALAGSRATFAREENCGRCVPCREGSTQLVGLLRDVYDGEFADGMLRELLRVVRETSLCGFGRDAARPVTTAMEAFETEFTAHAAGRCPAGTCNRS
jgi:NADH-quinone oxidoreductase subunit F